MSQTTTYRRPSVSIGMGFDGGDYSWMTKDQGKDATGFVIHDGNWSKGAPAEYKIDTSISVLKATTRFKSLLRPKGAKLV